MNRRFVPWISIGALALLGTLFLALDGLHYWHDIRFIFATTQLPFHEVLNGSFNPHQSWGPVDQTASAGFYASKVLHVWLLDRLFGLVPPHLGGLEVAVAISVLFMAATTVAVGILIGRVGESRTLGWTASVCFLLVPVVPYLAGKQLAEVTSLAFTTWGLLIAWEATRRDTGGLSVRALAAGLLLLAGAACRLDALFGQLGFFVAASWFAGRERRDRWLRVAGGAMGVLVVGYGALMLSLDLSVDEFARYLSSFVEAPNRPAAMSVLGIATFGGALYAAAALALFSPRRRLAGFFLVWWLLAWLPSVALTATFMVEPRYLAQGAVPFAGLVALGVHSLRRRLPSRWLVPAGAVGLVFLLAMNWVTIRLMPWELNRPALLEAVEEIERRSPEAAILVPWAYTDFNFLRVVRPSAPVYSVHSPPNPQGEEPERIAALWHERYRDWYGDRHLTAPSELSRLLESRPVFYLGWHRYPPVEFLKRVAASVDFQLLIDRLQSLELTDHLETSWVWDHPGLAFTLAGQVDQYEYYSVAAPELPLSPPETHSLGRPARSDTLPLLLREAAVEFTLPLPSDDDGSGGLIAHDLTRDGRMDFLVTRPGFVVAVDGAGRALWRHEIDVQVTRQAEADGLPGAHAPGVQVADVGGGPPYVFYLTRSGSLRIVDGRTGHVLRELRLTSPPGTQRWEHLVVTNLRGYGDRDLLLQATNARGYRTGRYVSAFSLDDLLGTTQSPEALWSTSDFPAAAHNGARVADLDGDGRDEILGAGIVAPDGRKLYELPVDGHVDAVHAADVLPARPGLEVVALEEGEGVDRVFLFAPGALIWQAHFGESEPQNAAVGDFAPGRPGLEIWCRSRHSTGQVPFVFDARGRLLAAYPLATVAPPDWTPKGLEVIVPIHWTGGQRQFLAAKARHESGDVAIVDALTGRFLVRIPTRADRLYVADVMGDWREEIVVLSGARLKIFTNPAANPRPGRASLWEEGSYRRDKHTWNYYSP